MTTQVQQIIVLALVIAFATVVPALAPSPLRSPYIAAFSATLLLGSVWYWGSVSSLFWRQRRAGAVLLDLGRAPSAVGGSVAGVVLSIGLALWALLTRDGQAAWVTVGFLSFAAYGVMQSLLPWFGRVQLRERGLALPAQYIPWERIGAYSVHDEMTQMAVLIRYRSRLSIWGYPWEVTIYCPANHWMDVATMLAEHIPRRGTRRWPPAPPRRGPS